MVHAENGDAIDVLVKQALAEGKTEPRYHALTRPPETEAEATNRAIQLARVAGSALYVVQQMSRSDYNLFEGTEVVGDVETVLLRGNVLVEGGELVAKPGVGQFVKRARFGEELCSRAAATA